MYSIWGINSIMKSSTLDNNIKLTLIEECEDCGKDISKKPKYTDLGDNVWKCEECYNK